MNRKWWTLASVCLAMFMLMLDLTVVNVALPSIQRSLNASFSDLQWVVDAYSLTLAAFLLAAGVVGDMFGRRNLFAIGLVLFSVASLVCGLAGSAATLDIARGAQGIGGSVMLATSLALIAQAFQGRDRGIAFGIYGSVAGGAIAVGPLIGGAITAGIGWRWIFFVNVPAGVVAVLVTLTRVAESRGATSRRLDWLGFVTLTAALFLLVFALVRGNDAGWGSAEIIGMLAGAAAVGVVFIVNELRLSDPMLDLALFRRPAMVGVSVATVALGGSIMTSFLYITLYLQDVLGYGPLATGVRFLPITFLAFALGPVAGRLTITVAARYLLAGSMAAIAVGCGLMALAGASSGWTVLLPGFIVAGCGMGIIYPAIASASIAAVPPSRSGMASGANSTFRQIGIAVGVAALGAVFSNQVQSRTLAVLGQTPAGRQVIGAGPTLTQAISSGAVRTAARSLPPAGQQALLSAYRTGFTSSFDHLMLAAAGIAVVGALAALTLMSGARPAPRHAPPQPEPAMSGSPVLDQDAAHRDSPA